MPFANPLRGAEATRNFRLAEEQYDINNRIVSFKPNRVSPWLIKRSLLLVAAICFICGSLITFESLQIIFSSILGAGLLFCCLFLFFWSVIMFLFTLLPEKTSWKNKEATINALFFTGAWLSIPLTPKFVSFAMGLIILIGFPSFITNFFFRIMESRIQNARIKRILKNIKIGIFYFIPLIIVVICLLEKVLNLDEDEAL
ncbi:MAG: hypothetical protein ABW189_06905 [Rickettsiales bacterium]